MALEARELLKNEGISAGVVNMHTIKPIDREAVVRAAAGTGAIVTAEEHSIIGGLGSAVAEVVCETRPVPVLRVGVNDKFGKSGKVPALLDMYGLTPANIAAKARAAVEMKK
jgi:transketolase